MNSEAVSLALLPPQEREQLLSSLTDSDAYRLKYEWGFWARPDQLPPSGEWLVWLVMAGRGFGKTRTGAEYIRSVLTENPGWHAALVGTTLAEVRSTMIEGPAGLQAVFPPEEWAQVRWNRTTCELWLPNGSHAQGYTADVADKLRGPAHHVAWADEIAKWKDAPSGILENTTWSNMMLGLRQGPYPRCVATTTPKPFKLIKELLADEATHVTRGSTYDNLTNLSPTFKRQVLRQFEGTRLGRQELHAEVLEDVEGALWTRVMIEQGRVEKAPETLVRCVVAIDPAVSVGENSAETGIVVVGRGEDGECCVLQDASGKLSPLSWAQRAVNLYEQWHADAIVAETNNGGDLVTTNIRTVSRSVPIVTVHASRGKAARAQPIASLYEQGRVHHVGMFPLLEDQLCGWCPDSGDPSPDRLDALVWGVTYLSEQRPLAEYIEMDLN